MLILYLHRMMPIEFYEIERFLWNLSTTYYSVQIEDLERDILFVILVIVI